jgi:hypothetical protein
MSDEKSGRRIAAAALGGLMNGVGQNVSDRVRKELAARSDGEPQSTTRTAAAALGGLVTGVGQNVSELVRQEVRAARSEAAASAKAAARGAGLLGGAAAAGHTAALFVGVAVWQGLGSRIGLGRSALVVAAVSGAAAVALARNGTAELARVQGARAARDRRGVGSPPASRAAESAAPPASAPEETLV